MMLYKEYLENETSSEVRDTWCFWLSIYCQYFNVDVMNLICNLLMDLESFIGQIDSVKIQFHYIHFQRLLTFLNTKASRQTQAGKNSCTYEHVYMCMQCYGCFHEY